MDLAAQLRTLEAAQGKPALLALATVDLAHHVRAESERARIKDALLAAAIPHWFNRDFLAALLETTLVEAESLLGQLRALRIVEPFPARGEHAANVHEATRLALREHLRTTDADRWQRLSSAARAHVAKGGEPHTRIEALYHLFAIDQAAAAAECEALDSEVTQGGRPEIRGALALALLELTAAGWLTGPAQIEARLAPLEVRNSRGEEGKLEAPSRTVLELARSEGYRTGIARAACLLGDALLAKGRPDEASAAYTEARAIVQELAASQPSNADRQRDLAAAHFRIGDIARTQGRLEEALVVISEGRDILQALASSDPSNAGRQRDLGVAHSRVGDVYQAQGRFDEALAAYRQDLAISQRLVASDPSNAGRQGGLAVAWSKIGDLYQAQGGRLDEALAAHQESLAVSANLVAGDPSNEGLQRELVLARLKVGDLHRAQGRLDDAFVAYQEGLAAAEDRASSDAANSDAQNTLAVAHSRLGDVYKDRGRLEDALAAFSAALDIFKRLASAEPSNPSWPREVVIAERRVAGVRRSLESSG
jgi:tetratricopeptide (TPR) repeat protein